MHHKTFSDNTLEEKDDWLFPDKVAIWLVSIQNKGKEDNRETDRINRRCIMKINYLTGTVTFDWDGEHANWGGEAKLLQQGYRYPKVRKTFSKFYRRHYELTSKFNVGLKTLLREGLSEPEFYGDLVYQI